MGAFLTGTVGYTYIRLLGLLRDFSPSLPLAAAPFFGAPEVWALHG